MLIAINKERKLKRTGTQGNATERIKGKQINTNFKCKTRKPNRQQESDR
jgi:hypothetical protein